MGNGFHPSFTPTKSDRNPPMTVTEDNKSESPPPGTQPFQAQPFQAQPFQAQPFQADVAKLLHLMVHSVYSDKSVFLRELIANAADACERLRYEAISDPALLGDDVKPRITVTLDAEGKRLSIEDNGIGMSRDEMIEALGTIARSGTKALLEKVEAAQGEETKSGNKDDKTGEPTPLMAASASGSIRPSWWLSASTSFRAAPVQT